MRKILEISYKGMDELLRLAEKQAQLLMQNAETAVANTVLFGVTVTANDCPVDTGRAKASIAGDFADLAGVDLEGDTKAIAEGKQQSVTGFQGLEGRYGSNVEYIIYLEYRGVKYNYQPKKSSKGFFRNNLPRVEIHFKHQMEMAIAATEEGRLLRKG